MTGSGRRYVLGLLTLAASVCGTSLGAHATGSPGDGESIFAVPPAGYSQVVGGDFDGPVDVARLAALGGKDIADLPADVQATLKATTALARTWSNGQGSRAIIVVFNLHDPKSADDFTRGAIDTARPARQGTFLAGLPGSVGFVLDQPDQAARDVYWSQGIYSVQLAVFAKSDADADADAKQFVTNEWSQLLSVTHVQPTNLGSGSHTSDLPYVLGKIAALPLIGLVVWLIVRHRRAAQRADAALFAQPPPP